MWKFLFFTVLLAIVYNDFFNRKIDCEDCKIISNQAIIVDKNKATCKKPRFLVDPIPKVIDRGSMESVAGVLRSLGYEMSEYDPRLDPEPGDIFDMDWDIMWTYFHWRHFPNFNASALKIHQKVQNHPGIQNLIRKHLLSTTTESKYVLKGFREPTKLKEYAEANPEKRFAQKLTSNKGITLKKYSEIDFNDPAEYFAQEFFENPLLIDGRMFDFGIYTLITSVDPLRVYYYTENCVLRFAAKPYNHSDFSDTDTYVIDYDKTWNLEFATFQDYPKNQFSNYFALRDNLKRVGVDPDHIFEQVEDCISTVFSKKEEDIIDHLEGFEASRHNFFTLVRCDFVVNKDGQLFLIEVNQSPNIGRQDNSYDRFKDMYRSMIRNVLDIVGVGPSGYLRYLKNGEDAESLNYVANDMHINTSPKVCMTDECKNNCKLKQCQLCVHCMDDETNSDLKVAYLEHMNMKNMKRVHPRSVNHLKNMTEEEWGKLNTINRPYAEWLIKMCEKNTKFC